MMKFIRYIIPGLLLLLVIPADGVHAHGSVVDEGDLCVISIGFYRAHFKIFQPRTSEQKEFCEDLPDKGESIFVMEYLHQDLGTVPIEFRIIRDVTGLGRFARLSDVQAIEDIDDATVFLQEPRIEPGVFTVLHQFDVDGDYLGMVTARHPETDQVYSAVFPFHVGATDWGYLPLFLLLVLLAQAAYLLTIKGWRPPWFNRKVAVDHGFTRIMMVLPFFLLLGATEKSGEPVSYVSNKGIFRVSYSSAINPLPLNQIHDWNLHLETADGMPVADAVLVLTGGMPAHNHGLATAPLVSAGTGQGNYQVEGLRFHMQGDWVLTLSIEAGSFTDTVVIPLSI